MGLYRRNDSKTWWMSFTADGKNYRRSTQTEDRDFAKRILKSIEGKIAEGKWFPEAEEKPADFKFRELAEKYKVWVEGRQKSAGWKGYVIKQLLEVFGNIPLSQFNTQMLEQFQTRRLKKGNKPATVNRLLAVISHMFTKAVDWKMMQKHVAQDLNVKMLPENNRRLRYLSKEECLALIEASDHHLKPIVITALNTGMRRGEILGLRWDRHIDLKHGFILLDNTKNGERREVPINQTVRTALQGLTRRIDVPYVFYDPSTGKNYRDLKKSFSTACRKAGIHDFHFHDLRHTFASHLVMSGVDLPTVKDLLGHKDIKMTLRYAHLSPTHKAKAVEILDGSLKGDFHVFFTVNEKEATPVGVTP
ncbi:MAG: site-specific integrase [Nitrospiraceae bacterium]|nr:site-specific integrase [Nitrospiraceae bacterium]